MNASQQPSSHHGIPAPKALLFITLVLYLSGCAHVPPPSRLVAIGDIHGTFEGFAVILQRAQLIDASWKTWLGPDGRPLPFKNADEALHFLAGADIESQLAIPTGVTKPKKLLLEKNGVRAHAIFHYHHDEDRRVSLGGKTVRFFRDSYRNQVAAYEMSRLLGISNVPPTVLRKMKGRKGSLQLWIENAMNEKDVSILDSSAIEENQKPKTSKLKSDMRVFDNLINNIDRNRTNILYDANWQLWLIDHTRAFGRETALPDTERLRRCSRPLWEKLRSLNDQRVYETLEPYMGKWEIRALLTRRDKIIEWLNARIEKEGEDNVLFDYPSP